MRNTMQIRQDSDGYYYEFVDSTGQMRETNRYETQALAYREACAILNQNENYAKPKVGKGWWQR